MPTFPPTRPGPDKSSEARGRLHKLSYPKWVASKGRVGAGGRFAPWEKGSSTVPRNIACCKKAIHSRAHQGVQNQAWCRVGASYIFSLTARSPVRVLRRPSWPAPAAGRPARRLAGVLLFCNQIYYLIPHLFIESLCFFHPDIRRDQYINL